MTTKTEQLFDIVIYEIATGIISSFGGKAMRRDTGFHNAEKRLDTVHSRISDDFSAAIVEAGEYRIGDVYVQS